MDLQSSLFCYKHITILTFPSLRTSPEITNRIQNRELLGSRAGGVIYAVNGDNSCNVTGFCFGEKILELIFVSIFNFSFIFGNSCF